MSRSIARIRGDVGQERAEHLIADIAGDWTSRVEAKLHYPYFWYLLRYSAKTLFGESGLRVSCLIDGRTKVGATTDAFDLERVDVPDDEVIDTRLDEAEARHLAERYTAYVVRNKRKALVFPKVTILERSAVYKVFWIVECSKSTRPGFRVMVDGVTGGFHVLSPNPPC